MVSYLISKQKLKDLLNWAFYAGKNDVPDKYFADALIQTINDMRPYDKQKEVA
jgi:hypothetical protein